MKFDTIIIGGGLSGLIAGINLSQRGQKCMIISAGQSALHFFSGSFELYGKGYEHPLDAIEHLEPNHPYAKLGAERIHQMSEEVKPFFQEIGIILNGSIEQNHYRITPMGTLKPAWLTMEEYATIADPQNWPWSNISILNLDGYLDFQPNFIASGLAKFGITSKISTLSLPELEHIRKNPTEMRATHISKALTGQVIDRLAALINLSANVADAIFMPAVISLTTREDMNVLKEKVNRPLRFIATLPPSVPGIRMQIMLRRYFQKLGGIYMLGDRAVGGTIKKGKLTNITTENHGDFKLEADHFIFATGSFFSHGITATSEKVYEPILNLDVDYQENRTTWYDSDIFKEQPYMKFGIASDEGFHALKDGKPIENTYVVGASLSGFNAIKEGSGAGVSIFTAMYAANEILKNR